MTLREYLAILNDADDNIKNMTLADEETGKEIMSVAIVYGQEAGSIAIEANTHAGE